MKWHELLKSLHTKQQRDEVIDWITRDNKRFDNLILALSHEDDKISNAAAWVAGYCVERSATLKDKHWRHIISLLSQSDCTVAMKRNTFRMMQFAVIPAKFAGELMEFAFRYFESPVETVAVKVFSLAALEQLAKNYPEIIPEIKLIIEDQLPGQTAAFKSRAEKFLKKY